MLSLLVLPTITSQPVASGNDSKIVLGDPYGGLSGSKFNFAILQFAFVITLLCFLIIQFGLLVTAPKFVIDGFKYPIL